MALTKRGTLACELEGRYLMDEIGELERIIGQCVLDRKKRRTLLAKDSIPELDERAFIIVKEKLSMMEDIALIEGHKHLKPLSMIPVNREAILPSAARYNSFLRFVENRKGLVIQYTKKCNFKCAHCMVNCESKRDERIDRGLLREVLQTGIRQGYQKVMFTGGEPLIHRADLLEDLAFAKSLGYVSSVGTNGYWGVTSGSASELLSELNELGVRRIALSTGEFHLPFVSFNNILNILDAGRSFPDIRIQVKLTGIDGVDDIMAMLRESYPEVNVRTVPLMPAGRAVQLSDYFFNKQVTVNSNGRCSDVCRPFVGCDGTIWRCCNIDEEKSQVYHFALGHFQTDGLPQLSTDKLRRFLFLIGPAGLARWLKNSKFDISCLEESTFSSTCHLCGELLNSPEFFIPIIALMAAPEIEYELDKIEAGLAGKAGLETMLDGRKVPPC